MSARTRRSLTLLWTALFLFSLVLQSVQLATPVAALAVHNEGLFELDGNVGRQRRRRRLETAFGTPTPPSSRLHRPTPINGRRVFTGGGSKDTRTSRTGTDDNGRPRQGRHPPRLRGAVRHRWRQHRRLRSRPLRQQRRRACRLLVLPGRDHASTADNGRRFTAPTPDGDVFIQRLHLRGDPSLASTSGHGGLTPRSTGGRRVRPGSQTTCARSSNDRERRNPLVVHTQAGSERRHSRPASSSRAASTFRRSAATPPVSRRSSPRPAPPVAGPTQSGLRLGDFNTCVPPDIETQVKNRARGRHRHDQQG